MFTKTCKKDTNDERKSVYSNDVIPTKTLQEMIDYEKRDSYDEGLKDGIIATINICKSLNLDSAQTKDKIVEQFSITEEQADEYLNLYW